MNRSPSPLWLSPPRNIGARMEQVLQEGLGSSGSEPVPVFFRADDIGVPSDRFTRLLAVFAKHRIPLSLAVVPVWLTRARWRSIRDTVDRLALEHAAAGGKNRNSLWCWHQHGWRHRNHEPFGKKQEFGPSRSAAQIEKDLHRGRERLTSIMGRDFYPAFTPPWNRCGLNALNFLQKTGYRAVSRSRGEPSSPSGLPDFSVNVDLHTRKEADSKQGWGSLLAELKTTVAGGFCGIMIHHQRMNPAAFAFLDQLLATISRFTEFRTAHLRDLVESGATLKK